MEAAKEKSMSLLGEFFDFMKKFGVIGLAIGVVTGNAVNEYVKVVVNAVIQPIVNIILFLIKFNPSGEIVPNIAKTAEENEAFAFKIGELIGATINFAVIMLVVFLFVRLVVSKLDKEAK